MHPYQIGSEQHTFNWENISSATHIKWYKSKDDREREKRKAIPSSPKQSADKQKKATK